MEKNKKATTEQVIFSEESVETLVVFNKISISHKNMWERKIIKLLLKHDYTPNAMFKNSMNKFLETGDFKDGFNSFIYFFNRSKIYGDTAKLSISKNVVSPEDAFYHLSIDKKKEFIIYCLKNRKGKIPVYTIDFMKRTDKEFKEKVETLTDIYNTDRHVDKEKNSQMEAIFDSYNDEDKLYCVKNHLENNEKKTPQFYLDWLRLQSEEVKKPLREARKGFLSCVAKQAIDKAKKAMQVGHRRQSAA